MAKKWKTALTNAFLRGYVALTHHLKKGEAVTSQHEFSSIVVYSTTALGDLMFNTPAIAAIRKRYPSAYITLISSHKNRALVEESSCFNEVIYWDEKVRDIRPVIQTIRKNKAELAVILHSKPPYDILSAVLGGCRYIMKDVYGDSLSGLEALLAHPVQPFDGHLIQRKLNLVALLGCDIANHEMFIPVAFPVIDKHPEKIRIGFQMGASGEKRCWPVPKFITLAKSLLAQGPNYEIVLIGTSKEKHLETQFFASLTPEERTQVVSYIDKTGLKQLLGIMKNMDVLVTGDTGPLHLAIALKTKTVSLFVTANPRYTGPYQDARLHQVIYIEPQDAGIKAEQRFPLDVISAERVYALIKEMMSEKM